ncbi:MAG: hypothetical protein FWF81_02130 [Defluviitaleaceae bacterium]|nr:hypothetical protein [Defluviitaleaceae bacterium]
MKNCGIGENGAFCGYIMREDEPVAEINSDKVISFSENAPLFIQRGGDFNEWLTDRGADLSRSYMRTILGHLRQPLLNIKKAVKFVCAASLTDSFWIREKEDNIVYANIIFKSDLYFKAALQGDPDIFELPVEKTPEITSIGSFNKGWRMVSGKWRMYKSGKPLEIFSELFTSKLAIALGLDAVKYFIIDGFIVCENFVKDGECFEHAKSLIGDEVDYKKNIAVFGGELNMAKQYMDLIFMDALVRNGDRHEFNYGVITSKNASRFAPNFDNNLALFHNGIPKILTRKDRLVLDFIEIYKQENYSLPLVTAQIIRDVLTQTLSEYPIEIDENILVQFCMNAYEQIKSALD